MEKIPVNAQISVTGNVELYSFPADKIKSYNDFLLLGGSPAFPTFLEQQSKQFLVDKGYNSVLNNGIDWLKDIMLGVRTSDISITHCGVGSSNQAIDTANDTDLIAAIGSRIQIQTRYSGGTGIAKFDGFYTPGDNNGTWVESILAYTSSGASAFARKLLTSSYTKDTTKSALLSWVITITIV